MQRSPIHWFIKPRKPVSLKMHNHCVCIVHRKGNLLLKIVYLHLYMQWEKFDREALNCIWPFWQWATYFAYDMRISTLCIFKIDVYNINSRFKCRSLYLPHRPIYVLNITHTHTKGHMVEIILVNAFIMKIMIIICKRILAVFIQFTWQRWEFIFEN